MTERLYYSDSYLTEFEATTSQVTEDGMRVYLDATAFYPTSGGQPHDTGAIGGVQVVDVIDEGEQVSHVLSAPLPTRGGVRARVDWARRFDHMQQHTGQHLLSAIFEDLFGCATVSVHFGAEYSTLDLSGATPSRKDLIRAEDRANAVTTENRAVTVTTEDSATATGLRKASDRRGPLRIVTIADLDRSACGGTHVRATGEIGSILLRGSERVRDATRVRFVCGSRAVHRARADYEGLSAIAASLSCSIDESASLVGAQSERLRDAESARKRLDRELATFRARALYEGAPVDPAGIRTIVLLPSGSMDDARTLAQSLIGLPKVLVVAHLVSPPSLLVASSEDSGLDAGQLLRETIGLVGGRGGGSARLAQGSVPSAAALNDALRRLAGPRS